MKKIHATLTVMILLVFIWNPSNIIVKSAGTDWWNHEWQYRKEITIDHNMVDENLTNFPILFHNTSINFASHAQTDGDDFVFISSDGTTKYYHEIEYYNSNIGELISWVNITSLSSTVDTLLYLYYGNPNCGNQENIVGTWNSDYIMVQHLSETTGIHYDSTSYNNDGVPQGSLNQDASGMVDGADEFDGFDDYVNIYDDDSLSFGDGSDDSPFTISVWVYMTGINTEYQCLVSKAESLTNAEYLLTTDDSSRFTFYMIDQSEEYAFIGRRCSKPSELNRWYYLIGTYDGSGFSDGIKIYLDGSRVDDLDASQGDYKAMENSDRALYIGKYSNTYTEGFIDEVRVSKGVKSDEWIRTSYNSIINTNTFLNVGSEQTKPENTPPSVEITYPQEGETVNGIITISGIADDPDGIIEYVQIKIDDNSWEYASGTVIWTYEWNTWQQSDGNHKIYARSFDGEYYSEEHIVNVTIENGIDDIPPEVEILTPHYGCIYFTIGDTLYVYVPSIPFITLIIGRIYVIVNASDNIGVESITYYVDDHYMHTDYELPYIWLWNNQTMLFTYELRVVARDFAGNVASEMIKVWRVQVREPQEE
ncbi:MAG: hypothetical protein JSU91_02770 [Thermoplasmatales archaeon]|nr:MAG: hypothetical protein JSU91_02770 [Thermoplasmatales archaeon]